MDDALRKLAQSVRVIRSLHRGTGGRDVNNTQHEPHKRAEEQGYSIKGYHFTRGNLAQNIAKTGKFDPTRSFSPDEEATFFWTHPEAANEWAKLHGSGIHPPTTPMAEDALNRRSPVIMPVRINPRKHLDVNWLEHSQNLQSPEYYNPQLMGNLINHAKRNGYDTMRIRNMSEGMSQPHDQIAVLNPSVIRSEFAQFNPERQHENDIGAHTGGYIAKSGGGEVIPHGDPRRDENLARHMEGSKTPPVLYHGTNVWNEGGKQLGDIKTFNRRASVDIVGRQPSLDTLGHWFTSNPDKDGASMYAGSRGTVYPVHVSIKNPHVTSFDMMQRRARMLANGVDDKRKLGEHEVEAYRNWLKQTGKDGVQFTKDKHGEFSNQDVWVALEPHQIKSAIGNNGHFDPHDPDITKSKGGDVEGYATKGAVMDPLELAKSVKPLQQTMPVAQQSMSNMPMMPNPVMPQHPLQKSYEAVNKTGITVSPRPGKGGGPPIIPGKGFNYDPELETDREHWTPATPNLLGTALPPPIQHPVFQEPDMEKLQDHAHRLLKNPKAMRVMQEVTGLDPKGFKIMPTYGTWKGEKEPSFILQHPDMTDDAARKGANLLGFGWQQDAAVRTQHNPAEEEGIPNVFIGHGKKFSADDVDRLTSAATKRGRDLTITPDGKAAQFSHFGEEKDYPKFLDDVNGIADETGMKHRLHAHMNGDLHNAKGYLAGIFGEGGEGEGLPASVQRSPDLFKRIVDHILKPYAQATASEGYRLSPERLQSAYGLTHDETNYVRNALYPPKSADRSSVPIMTGEEQLDVRPTGDRGQNTVGDVLYALQNRAASKGQIDTNDYSPLAMKRIAEIMAREVAYHVANSDKSAIGWYDEALKKAMAGYHTVFPELKTDKQKEMLFKAILGITSQGADVHTNSINASRLYSLIRNKNMTLPEATKQLSGSFGKETGAIENNLHKFHHLVTTNGYDAMQNIMNQTRTVSEWNKILGKNKNLYDHNGKPMDMQGGANQKVTGWTVFGPKIGSFINNLNGNFSTLTSDLWFSRTWNRMLGHNFIHSPKAEQKQYGDFRDALKAEYYHSNPNVKIGTSYKTANGKISKDANGKPEEWEYGDDATQLSHDQFTKMIDDPEEMMKYADQLHSIFKKGNYKNKSDLRRRAKSLIENRILPVAAPRGDKERDFQQNTAEEAQRMLKRQGLNISIADIQAALWFHEKELMGRFGAATEKSKPADYEDAAKNTIDMIKSNTLFKSKGKKEEPEEPLSTGGVVRRAYMKGGKVEGSIWHGKDANVEYGAPTNSAIVQHVLAKIAAPLPATIYPQGSVTGRRQ